MKLLIMDNRYCFFCVGTGGHVLPAKNLIESLLNSGLSSKDIYIVTDLRGAKYFEDIDIDVITKSFYVSSKGILEYLKSTKQFISTLRELYFELRSKNIKTIVTTGAYVAPYAALISLLINSKLFIQEQNQYAGLGNKVASYFPSKVVTSFPDTKNIRKKNIIHTGPVLNIKLTKDKYKKNTDTFTIGIQGGSQGSDEINQYLFKFLENFKDKKVNFVHITGPNKNVKHRFDLVNYKQYEFIDDMDSYYKNIDFQISRAGGGILEAAYLSIPQLLIPYKFGTTSSHQLLNAEYLKKNKIAVIAHDYAEFCAILQDVCLYKNKYLNENFHSPNIKVGNEDIFNLITLGENGKF